MTDQSSPRRPRCNGAGGLTRAPCPCLFCRDLGELVDTSGEGSKGNGKRAPQGKQWLQHRIQPSFHVEAASHDAASKTDNIVAENLFPDDRWPGGQGCVRLSLAGRHFSPVSGRLCGSVCDQTRKGMHRAGTWQPIRPTRSERLPSFTFRTPAPSRFAVAILPQLVEQKVPGCQPAAKTSCSGTALARGRNIDSFIERRREKSHCGRVVDFVFDGSRCGHSPPAPLITGVLPRSTGPG